MNYTRQDWRKFHYGQPQKPKVKPVSYSLIADHDGYIFCTGAYALCVYKKKFIEVKTTIKPNYL